MKNMDVERFFDLLFIDMMLVITVILVPLIAGVQAGRVTHWTIGAVFGVLVCSLISAAWWAVLSTNTKN